MGTWRRRWRLLPWWARAAIVVYVAGFLVGTRAHVADLLRGGPDVYATTGPPALQAFFLALVVLDPLVALLLAAVRPAGVRMAMLVIAADAAANYALAAPVLGRDPWWAVRPSGLLGLTAFTVFVLATGVPLARRATAAVAGAQRARR